MTSGSSSPQHHRTAAPVEPFPCEPPAGLKILPNDEAMARLARALAHPTRVAIVRHILQSGEGVCTDLSEVVPLAHSTAMQHIKILKEAGLLRSSRHGRHVLYL
jgi:DNA-binding transcriptional ArsR family regulator